MSHCRNSITGRPKIKHLSKDAAWKHAEEMERHGVHQYNVYRCYLCGPGVWHVGRKSVKWRKQPYDEVLVGKLIGALKLVINK